MLIAIVSDTHLPRGARVIPARCLAEDFQILNPGSPTERRRAPSHTMALGHVRAGSLEFELIDF